MNDSDRDRDCGHIKSSKYQDLTNHFTNLKIIFLWDFNTVPLIYCEKKHIFDWPGGLVKERFFDSPAAVFTRVRATANFEPEKQPVYSPL